MTVNTELTGPPDPMNTFQTDLPHSFDGRQIAPELQDFRRDVSATTVDDQAVLTVGLTAEAVSLDAIVGARPLNDDPAAVERLIVSGTARNRLNSHPELHTKVVSESELGDVQVISGYRSGPETLEHHMTEDAYRRGLSVYERDRAPHASLAYGRSLGKVFGERMRKLQASGNLPTEGELRICILGSGPCIEVKGLLDELQNYPDIYSRTVVTVTDKYDAPMQAVQRSGYLDDHIGEDVEISRVKFLTRDAANLNFDRGQEPHMLVACNVLSATAARRLVDSDDEKGVRLMLQAANFFGKRPLVKVDRDSGEVITVPTSHLTPKEFLDQLSSAADRDVLHDQLFGRLVEVDETRGSSANREITPPTTLPLSYDKWQLVKHWGPRKLSQLFGKFLHGNTAAAKGSPSGQNVLRVKEWYNFSEDVEDFAAVATQCVDPNIGIVIVSDYGRADPNEHAAAPFEATSASKHRISRHFGDISHNLVEMWRIKEEAEAAGAQVSTIRHQISSRSSLLIDRSSDGLLRTDTKDVWDKAVTNVDSSAIQEISAFIGVIKQKVKEHAGGTPQDISEIIEREFADSSIPAHAKDSPELLTEIAAICNQLEIFDTGSRFARRAIETAPHISALSHVRLAEAQFAVAFGEEDDQAFIAGRDEAESTLLEARTLFPDNPVVHETLLAFYQATENPAGIVRASTDYLNTARGLSPDDIVRQLKIQCDAQMSLVNQPSPDKTPAKVSIRRRDISSQGISLGGVVYAPFTTRFTQSSEPETLSTVGREMRIKAQTMVSSSIKAITELNADGLPWLYADTLESLGAYLDTLGHVRISELEKTAAAAGSLILRSLQ